MFLRFAAVFFCLVIAACAPPPPQPSITVSLVADGRELIYRYTIPVTVAQFLRDAEIEKGELDRVSPPEFTQIADGMRVTVVRVREETECQRAELPYRQQMLLNEGLQPGEELLAQSGANGIEEICYRVSIADGIRQDPVEISRVVITAPRDELIYVGPTTELDPVPITGNLAYISSGNAWVMSGSSTTKRPLTTSGGLDQRAFSLSDNGRQLLFSRSDSVQGFSNQLWLIPDINVAGEPIQLVPEDVLYAAWVPGQENTITYSTAEAQQSPPGWNAANDLWTMRIDPRTGDPLNLRTIVSPSTGGLYGWWGTNYQWSPDGALVAWSRADSVGLVDMNSGELQPLLRFPLFNPRADWSWRATLSWSDDASLLLTTVHGPPIGSEPPEFSPVFNVAVAGANGSFSAEIVENAGIWSAPQFSPLRPDPAGDFPVGYIAYLQAREISNSINPQAEYDLIIADRDGSNNRAMFPGRGQPGLNAQHSLAWSPDGRQIAFIYQGNLWILDVASQIANQLTLDGAASKPVWTR